MGDAGRGSGVALPSNLPVTREIAVRATFRFDAEFGLAVDPMGRGRIEGMPRLTARACEALRSRATGPRR